jgi:hypothetical protein
VTSRGHVERTLTIVYHQLISWVGRWMPEDQTRHMAASCMVGLVRDAMLGLRTSYGPYRALYASAEFHMRWWGQANGFDVPFGVWRTIPVPVPELVSELARTYALLHQASELGQVSMPEQDLLMRMLYAGRYDAAGHWSMPVGDIDVPVAIAIVERVVKVLDGHVCVDWDGCDEFRVLWEREDRASARWLASFQHHARSSVHGW